MNSFIKRFNLFTVLVAILTFLIGWQLGHKDIAVKWSNYKPSVNVTNQQSPKDVTVDFKLFWDTWELVSKTYYDKTKIDQQKMFYGAIQGMVAAIGDPYTVFLPPQQQKATSEQLGGSFEGVGMELGFNKDSQLVVIAPLDGSPAEKAGMKTGDLIVKIDGKDTLNTSLPDAVNLIRGPKGTSVTLTIFRTGEKATRDIKITRDTIIIKSVVTTFKTSASGKKIAVVKLSQFGERTIDEWNESVSSILSSGAEGMVLDLRNNPGGYLTDAVYIGSEFLSDGNVVLQQDASGKKVASPVNRAGKLTKLPLVVLINKGSASASEIVAGALQDHKRAQLVGEKSFGKGTVQEAEPLSGGAGIHITIAKWLTPNSRWVNSTQGLDPDVKVENPVTDTPTTVDPQLDKALDILN